MTGPAIWVVVTCMGRLAHLKRSAPRLLCQAGVRYCLVDYSCPDAAGDWLSREFGGLIEAGHVVVERVPDQRYFNKSAAQNAGARRALKEGAEYLCHLDADTLVAPEFCAWLMGQVAPERFLIAALTADGRDEMSLTGVLVQPVGAFEASGGFDESFEGWGAEDIEYRLRLFLLCGYAYHEIPLGLLQAIAHDDELRGRWYREPDIKYTNRRHQHIVQHKVWRHWAGRWQNDYSSAKRLWFHAGGNAQPGFFR